MKTTLAPVTIISARKLAIFSANVVRHRKALGLTKTDFASHTSVSRDTIRRIETRPEGYIPSFDTVAALAIFAEYSPKEMLGSRLNFQ